MTNQKTLFNFFFPFPQITTNQNNSKRKKTRRENSLPNYILYHIKKAKH